MIYAARARSARAARLNHIFRISIEQVPRSSFDLAQFQRVARNLHPAAFYFRRLQPAPRRAAAARGRLRTLKWRLPMTGKRFME